MEKKIETTIMRLQVRMGVGIHTRANASAVVLYQLPVMFQVIAVMRGMSS